MTVLEQATVSNVEVTQNGFRPPSTASSVGGACSDKQVAQDNRINAVATAARNAPSNSLVEESCSSGKVLGPGLYHDDDVCSADDVCIPQEHQIHPLQQLGRIHKRGLPDQKEHDETSDSTSVPETDAPEGTEVDLDAVGNYQPTQDSAAEAETVAPTANANAQEPSVPMIFAYEETTFVFDWDDTMLPSTWIQSQGLRLDEGSEVSDWQRSELAQVAEIVAETLRIAKRHGTVILITNAERGWIELSCRKFLPTLYPCIEGVKIVSARTSFEGPHSATPLDWKLRAFESELLRIFGPNTLNDVSKPKNLLSLGDGMHEREALLRLSKDLPNCRSKSLKFVERPDIAQICKQHTLVKSCCDRIIQHDGNLDLCIRCA